MGARVRAAALTLALLAAAPAGADEPQCLARGT